MKPYILFYGDKKLEDNICILNMFEYSKEISIGWTELDVKNDLKIIEKEINEGCKQIIFLGLEIGWDKIIESLKEKYDDLKIKVICTTQDSLLYYEYERENFFKLLELSKNKKVYDIAFLRKSQYETYKKLGYNCSYLMENYILKEKYEFKKDKNNTKIQLGIYPLNYTWDKNIFNQLCIPKFIENSNLNYYSLDPRMKEFLETMNIDSIPEKNVAINEKHIINSIVKNDVIIATSFTEYMHPVFFISMEIGIPCLIGNNSDFFISDKYKKIKDYLVTSSEDNPIINSNKVKEILNNKEEIKSLYKEWKKEYNELALKNREEFIQK